MSQNQFDLHSVHVVLPGVAWLNIQSNLINQVWLAFKICQENAPIIVTRRVPVQLAVGRDEIPYPLKSTTRRCIPY